MKNADVTLGDPDFLEAWIYCSPGACKLCLKPHFRIPAIPDATFTILIACLHHPDLVDDKLGLPPNKAVAKILPDSKQDQTCRSNLLVAKHSVVPDSTRSNSALPIVDVVPDDYPHIDEMVCRWVIHLHGLPPRAHPSVEITMSS
ncbi:hypothetical protein B0H13DRAFT_2333284 [Mycena leptocephala]|nr:hypothetical protein B0H13DRAFT_2333284 [Mycena leptocephala]